MSFLGEIRRRKVFQVAAVYAVVAWLVIQVVGEITGPLNLPDWLHSVVIVLLAVGFPISLILAWAFDVTPEGVTSTSARPAATDAPQQPMQWLMPATQLVVLLAVGFLLVDAYVLEESGRSPQTEARLEAGPQPLRRFAHVIPPDDELTGAGRSVLAVSPDGRYFVYNTDNGLMLRSEDDLVATLLPATEGGASNPFFSPDSSQVAYFANPPNRLMTQNVNGGAPVQIATEIASPDGASWGEDGFIYLSQPDGIWQVSPQTSERDLIIETRDGALLANPRLLPDGDSVIFSAIPSSGGYDEASIFAASLTTEDWKEIIPGGSDASYIETGHLLYAYGDELFAKSFDLENLTPFGNPESVARGLLRGAMTGAGNYGLTRDGSLLYLTGQRRTARRVPVWFDRTGTPVETIGVEPRAYLSVQLLRDGSSSIALLDSENGGSVSIWHPDRSAATPLPFLDSAPSGLAIVGETSRIAYSRRTTDGSQQIHSRPVDGIGIEALLTQDPDRNASPSDLSIDGKTLFYHDSRARRRIWRAEQSDSGDWMDGIPVETGGGESYNATLHPSGNFLAYQQAAGDRVEVYVVPYPETTSNGPWLISSNGGARPRWSSDGTEILYLGFPDGDDDSIALMAAEIELSPTFRHGTPRPVVRDGFVTPGLSRNVYDVARDGQRFLMLTDLPAQEGDGEQYTVVIVQNFLDDLVRRMSTNR